MHKYVHRDEGRFPLGWGITPDTRARTNATLGPEGERVNFWGARAASFAVPLGLGLLLGLIGPTAEHWGGHPGAAVGAVFTGGWPWACYAFLVGYFRRSKIESVVLAPLGLAIGVVTYYLTKETWPP